MQHVNFCNSAESDISCSKPTLRLSYLNRPVFVVLFLFSISFCYAQVDVQQRNKALLVNLAQPILGQFEVGLFVEGKSNFDYFVYGRYNFNRVPNILQFPYIYDPNGYTHYGYEYGYEYYNATESGYTVGGQIRYKLRGNQIEYYKYLDAKNLKSDTYLGGWLEFGNSISTDLPNNNWNINDTKATLIWNNVSGGLLLGAKGNLGKSLMWDAYAGLGVNNYNAQLSYTDFTSGTPKTADLQEETTIGGKIGIQLGYKF